MRRKDPFERADKAMKWALICLGIAAIGWMVKLAADILRLLGY